MINQEHSLKPSATERGDAAPRRPSPAPAPGASSGAAGRFEPALDAPWTERRPIPAIRSVRKGIPPSPTERNRLLRFARNYVAEFNPVPPLPLEQLREHAARLLKLAGAEPAWRNYAGVLINNELWRETLASIPYQKRLLLLPKCLRSESQCPAPFDDLGLVCKQCGLCSIQDLQTEASQLGYAVLVAEGSAMVTSLIQTGKIEAIIGVSCLNVLERAFPFMEAAAIPGLAIPLLQDDCADTTVDLDWVWDYIHLTKDDQTRRLDLSALREDVESWFAPDALDEVLGPAQGETERIAREWLARAGKRWRPFLAVAVFQALRADAGRPFPKGLRALAVAIECFHKASLIHDDIEDGDATRYGEKTLHAEHGLPVALNSGDHLLGEGYRLLAACPIAPDLAIRMVQVAADGQRQLCRGQGAELCWMRAPHPLAPGEVLEIFRHKTAPAFEVALRLGALYAEGTSSAGNASPAAPDSWQLADTVRAYSQALGVAYQIRDDLEDCLAAGQAGDLAALRPGLLLAIAFERAAGEDRALLDSVWRRAPAPGAEMRRVQDLLVRLEAPLRARALLESHKDDAVRSLRALDNPNLKGLLRRIIGRIFDCGEIPGWCREFQPPHEPAA